MTSHVRGLQDPTDAGEVDAGIFDADMPGRRISTSCEAITVEQVCDDEPECRWAWRKNKCKTRKNRRLEDPTDAGAVDAGIFDADTPGRRLNAPCNTYNDVGACEGDSRGTCVWKPNKKGVDIEPEENSACSVP